MTAHWKTWCRLCAKEDGCKITLFDDKQGSQAMARISKYLSIQIQDSQWPNSLCLDCFNVLSDFDVYATKCLKIQQLFFSFIDEKQDKSIEFYKYMRDECLLTNDKNINTHIDKFKEENVCSITNNLREDNCRKARKCKKLLESNINETGINIVKSEIPDNDMNDAESDSYIPSNYSDSDEDYNIPLASVTDIKNIKTLKTKMKKPKTSTKSKVKKKNKMKDREPSVDMLSNDVDVKIEPLSDAENDNLNVLNTDERKIKKEKKTNNTLSFLKYDCYICGEDSKNWNALCIHFRDIHDARAKIMCCCGKFLASRVSIGRHSAKHGKASNSFECTKCSKRFPRESELRTHMISHLPKEEHPFVCCKCGRRFTTQQLLRHHEKKHIPMEERMVHTCDKCQSKFASKNSLMMHMKAIHEKLKPFVCDQCGRAFTTKGILEEHQVRHSDARPHVCSVCNKSFKTKQRLAIHSDTHNDTVYQCPHCPIRLNSRRTLRMHLFVHDEVCRYKCDFCDKAFKRAKDLKNHSNLHTGRRPYSCPWCTRTFANGSNCRAHKRRMHPNELRILDATTAMENKVTVNEECEEKRDTDNGQPKVIYTTVKRKLPATPLIKTPNFVFPPDVSDKDAHLEIGPNAKLFGETKKENKSPVCRNYESSMSPLNLNKTSSSKQNDMQSNLTVTAMNQGESAINDYQAVAESYNALLQTRALENSFNSSGFKDSHQHVFSKNTQLFSNFSNNLYGTGTTLSQFTPGNPYGIQFSRDEAN